MLNWRVCSLTGGCGMRSCGLRRRSGGVDGRSFSLDSAGKSRHMLRKQLSPLLKLVHPDFFSQHSENIQEENMKFLQSLNSLIDNLELLNTACRRRNMCDINPPLMSTYEFNFHLKTLSRSDDDTESVPLTRAVNIKLDVPRDLTFRQSASSSVIRKRIATLLHRVGAVFEAANIASPWTAEDSHDVEGSDVSWNSRKGSPTHGFRRRRNEVGIDDPSIKATIEEKTVEKAMSDKINSIFGGGGSHQLLKEEIEKYIKNGNIAVANLSPIAQMHAIKRLRDFFLKYGHLIGFSFNSWSNILIVIDGTLAKNTFKKENLKKRIVLIISPKFQSSNMSSYVNKSLPQARIIMPTIDGLHT